MNQSDKRLYWAEIIQRQTDSALSVAAYCKQNQLTENTFYYWRKKLNRAEPASIHPIVINDDSPFNAAVVCIELPNGIRAELPIHLSPGQIRSWLKALQC